MSSSSEPEQLRKIFVGGLNRRTTEEALKEYFSLWGNIVDCVIMREGKNGPSRGFGFVTFDNAKAVDDCLKVKRHEIDNWEIEPKRSVPKGEAQSRTRKIFVGGLASTATEEDVEEYFTGLCTKFGQGKVLDVDLKRDKENPNRIRGFAFVTFDSEEVVESVCSISFHQIKLKQCEVKKAESQATMRKKEEQEMIASGGSRRSKNSEENTPNFGGKSFLTTPKNYPSHTLTDVSMKVSIIQDVKKNLRSPHPLIFYSTSIFFGGGMGELSLFFFYSFSGLPFAIIH